MSGAPAETVDPEWVAFFIDGARYGDMEDIDAGLAQKVPVDSKDGSGRTALHMACANGHTEVIARLLEAGASPDVANDQGNTPLHWACLNGHKEAVKLLMDKGASAAVLNAVGRTPVDEALGRENQDIFELINSYNTAGSVAVEVVEEGGEDGEEEDGGAEEEGAGELEGEGEGEGQGGAGAGGVDAMET